MSTLGAAAAGMWSWQDPVALVCALLGLGLALRLHARLGKQRGCSGCPAQDLHRRGRERLHRRAAQPPPLPR